MTTESDRTRIVPNLYRTSSGELCISYMSLLDLIGFNASAVDCLSSSKFWKSWNEVAKASLAGCHMNQNVVFDAACPVLKKARITAVGIECLLFVLLIHGSDVLERPNVPATSGELSRHDDRRIRYVNRQVNSISATIRRFMITHDEEVISHYDGEPLAPLASDDCVRTSSQSEKWARKHPNFTQKLAALTGWMFDQRLMFQCERCMKWAAGAPRVVEPGTLTDYESIQRKSPWTCDDIWWDFSGPKCNSTQPISEHPPLDQPNTQTSSAQPVITGLSATSQLNGPLSSVLLSDTVQTPSVQGITEQVLDFESSAVADSERDEQRAANNIASAMHKDAQKRVLPVVSRGLGALGSLLDAISASDTDGAATDFEQEFRQTQSSRGLPREVATTDDMHSSSGCGSLGTRRKRNSSYSFDTDDSDHHTDPISGSSVKRARPSKMELSSFFRFDNAPKAPNIVPEEARTHAAEDAVITELKETIESMSSELQNVKSQVARTDERSSALERSNVQLQEVKAQLTRAEERSNTLEKTNEKIIRELQHFKTLFGTVQRHALVMGRNNEKINVELQNVKSQIATVQQHSTALWKNHHQLQFQLTAQSTKLTSFSNDLMMTKDAQGKRLDTHKDAINRNGEAIGAVARYQQEMGTAVRQLKQDITRVAATAAPVTRA
jgi:hypothetical protein